MEIKERLPGREYIPKDRLCVFCHKDKCDGFFVEGYMYVNCYQNGNPIQNQKSKTD